MPTSVMVVAIVGIVMGSLVTVFRIIFDRPKHGRNREPDASLNSQEWAELAALADRLTRRVETLERVLDASQPEWRGKP